MFFTLCISCSPESATKPAPGFPQAGGHDSAVADVKGDAINHGNTRVPQPFTPGGEPDDKRAFPVGTRKEVEARLMFLERLASECDDEVSAPHSMTHERLHASNTMDMLLEAALTNIPVYVYLECEAVLSEVKNTTCNSYHLLMSRNKGFPIARALEYERTKDAPPLN